MSHEGAGLETVSWLIETSFYILNPSLRLFSEKTRSSCFAIRSFFSRKNNFMFPFCGSAVSSYYSAESLRNSSCFEKGTLLADEKPLLKLNELARSVCHCQYWCNLFWQGTSCVCVAWPFGRCNLLAGEHSKWKKWLLIWWHSRIIHYTLTLTIASHTLLWPLATEPDGLAKHGPIWPRLLIYS